MIYIGVDPGASSGAIALQLTGGEIRLHDIPATKPGKYRVHDSLEIHRILVPYFAQGEGAIALIEKVQIDQRDAGHMRSAEGLVRCHEAIRTILICLGAGVIDAYPVQWRKTVGVEGGDKEGAIKLALQLFPDVQGQLIYKARNKQWARNHNRAEALLMMESAKLLTQKSEEVA